MKFKCSICNDEIPCVLTIKAKSLLPRFCPFDASELSAKWVKVKKKKEQGK